MIKTTSYIKIEINENDLLSNMIKKLEEIYRLNGEMKSEYNEILYFKIKIKRRNEKRI